MSFDVNPKNADVLASFLQRHSVDVTWAQRSVLPTPTADNFDKNGRLTSALDFARLDHWIGRWPNARFRFVYLAAGDDFAGARRGSPEFVARVASWGAVIVEHVRMQTHGVGGFGFLPVDEPRTAEEMARVVDWAIALHRADPKPLVFEDPVTAKEAVLDPILKNCDIVSPPIGFDSSQLNGTRLEHKTELWLYVVKGPAHALDPVSYFRLAAWAAFRQGAQGVSFWSFADAGGGSSWNEWDSKVGGWGFAPEYLSDTEVVDSKQMMAMVEGIEDYERLSKLRDCLGRARFVETSASDLAAARLLLTKGVDDVLAGVDRTRNRGNILEYAEGPKDTRYRCRRRA